MNATIPGFVIKSLATLASPGKRCPRLSILIYHRVQRQEEAQEEALNNWDVSALVFDGQMREIAANFWPLPLSEAVERLSKRSLPPRAICVTFDDGYADNADVALPILLRHKIPATFFIATGYLDGGRMWNDTVIEAIRAMPSTSLDLTAWGLGTLDVSTIDARRAAIGRILPALKYLASPERDARAAALASRARLQERPDPMMREEQIRGMLRSGMEIGAHTVTHPILTLTSADVARREIVESGRRLADILRVPVRLFAYPNGKPGQDYASEHVRMVREAGYTAAVSTSWGVATARSDVLQLPRFTPWDRAPDRFALRLVRNLVRRSNSLSVPARDP